jgi:DNA modification methylase
LGETGEWDLPELRLELQELEVSGFDLAVTGFSPPELDIIMLDEPEGEGADEEVIPDPPSKSVSRLGDVWIMGKHRLLCGNSLEPESYVKLLQGKLATAVLTDAPYNVKIANNVSGLGKKKHGEFKMASGEMSEAGFKEFLTTAHKHCADHLIDGGVAYSFMDWRSVDVLIAAGRDAGLQLINMAVWYKGSGSMGAFLRSAHEMIPIFCKGSSPKINNVALGKHGRDRTNVWLYPGANKPGSSAAEALKDHPSPKNVEMCVDAILDVTAAGDIVLDPFLGSGTTLIAAEKSGRSGYGIELDPAYADVCVRRWEHLTGNSAIHAETGDTFLEMASQRSFSGSVEEPKV